MTSKSSRSAATLVLMGLLAVDTAAAPPHQRYYKSGMNLIQSGNWAQAEAMMQRAIDVEPQEKRRPMPLRKDYFPHLYLGLARYNLGDCSGALAAWGESERQGAVVGRDPFIEVLPLRDECRTKGRPSAAGRSASESIGPSTGKEKVRTTQHVIERGADPTRKALGAIERVAPDSEVGEFASKGQKGIDALESVTDVIDAVLSPSEKLAASIDAYFVGAPQRTLIFLDGIDVSDPRARAQVFLFRAAAHFRLHRLGAGAAHLQHARENADRFQQEQWRGDFPTELFDPRFVRFVRGGG